MTNYTILLRMTPHTKAKHEILKSYLGGWFPILSRGRSKRIVYLDGFAGSGEYDDGSFGSPIIALEVAKNHLHELPADIIFMFIEQDEQRCNHLIQLLDDKYTMLSEGEYKKLPENFRIHVFCGEFNKSMSSILTRLEDDKSSLAPTLAFIDPFGYSDINFNVLSRILKFNKCELLITYMVGFLNRFIFDTNHRKSIKTQFDLQDDDIDKILSLNQDSREKEWLRLLVESLKKHSDKILYDLDFRVMNQSNQTMYYLVYFTKNIAGIRVMKRSMWKIGIKGKYLFSDFNFDPSQTSLLNYDDKIWITQAAKQIQQEFTGQEVEVSKIEEYVLTKTRFRWVKAILKVLEEEKRIEVIYFKKRRKGSYPDKSIIRFH